MVKGISRNIIEISDTGSDVFERAILFVRPQEREPSPAALESQARRYLRTVRLRGRMFRHRLWAASLLKFGIAAACGALVTFLLLAL